MYIKNIIILIICILTINIVIATDPSAYYHVDNTFNLNIPCYNAGAYCSASAICNITILDSQANTFIDNQAMSNNNAYHNITLNPTILGDYKAYVMCADGVYNNYNSFTFQVNNIGHKIDNMLPMLIFFILLISFVLFLLIVTIKIESPMMFPLMFLLSLIFSWTFFYIYMNTISLSRIYYSIYWFFLIISVGLLFIILWMATMGTINSFSQKNRRKQDLGDNF